MTSEQHKQRIRQLEFALEKADYGMGMPRDYQRVLELRGMLEDARKEARLEQLRSLSLRELRAVAHKLDPFYPCSVNDRAVRHVDVIGFILSKQTEATS